MARHARRLISWIGGGILALLSLVALAILVIVWLVDPNVWRARFAQVASQALGRQVLLGGDLHWHVGWTLAIASEGGSIANAPGFDAVPFARWQRIELGLNARELLQHRYLIDQLAIDGLQVHLQRDAAGHGNWTFTSAVADTDAEANARNAPTPALQVASLRLRNSQVTFSDSGAPATGSSATWQLDDLALDVRMPNGLATPRVLRDVVLRGRLSGGPLPTPGVVIAFQAASASQDTAAATLAVPAFELQWDEARLSGSLTAGYGTALDARGKLSLRVPSVRAQLARLGVTPPSMADPKTLGPLQVDGAFAMTASSLTATGLTMVLDDTRLAGTLSATRFAPLALRFDLDGDRIDFDRYLEPADHAGKPFELPLAQLKALDVQGALRVKTATIRGATATGVRIDVR